MTAIISHTKKHSNIYRSPHTKRVIKMDTDLLIEVLQTRIKAAGGNPTSRSLLYELVKALERLRDYESKEDNQ